MAASPKKYPAPTKRRFHRKIPRAELTVYFTKFIFTIPAGMEMSVRTMGSSLLTKTPTHPFSRRNRIFSSMTGLCFGNFLKYHHRSRVPPVLPRR